MILILKRRHLILVSAGILLILGACLIFPLHRTHQTTVDVFSPVRFQETIFFLDPGHGGEDGWAISISGASESALNLAIALRLDSVLHFYGAQTVMTREAEVSIHDEGARTIR